MFVLLYYYYASPCLWNQLPNSLRQRHSSPSVSNFFADAPATSSYSLNLPLSPSITPSPFHSRLKTYLFSQTIILAVDRRSRISTSIFTSGRSRQYLWSNNCISHSSLCCYIARRTLFIIAPYWINCTCLSIQKEPNMHTKLLLHCKPKPHVSHFIVLHVNVPLFVTWHG